MCVARRLRGEVCPLRVRRGPGSPRRETRRWNGGAIRRSASGSFGGDAWPLPRHRSEAGTGQHGGRRSPDHAAGGASRHGRRQPSRTCPIVGGVENPEAPQPLAADEGSESATTRDTIPLTIGMASDLASGPHRMERQGGADRRRPFGYPVALRPPKCRPRPTGIGPCRARRPRRRNRSAPTGRSAQSGRDRRASNPRGGPITGRLAIGILCSPSQGCPFAAGGHPPGGGARRQVVAHQRRRRNGGASHAARRGARPGKAGRRRSRALRRRHPAPPLAEAPARAKPESLRRPSAPANLREPKPMPRQNLPSLSPPRPAPLRHPNQKPAPPQAEVPLSRLLPLRAVARRALPRSRNRAPPPGRKRARPERL